MAGFNRGSLHNARRDYDKAIADFSEAIRLFPTFAIAYSSRGVAWKNKGEYTKALLDYNEALGFDRKNAQFHRRFAWLLATCPNATFRDGHGAIEMATKAGELNGWKVAWDMDALAAAYAETADFEKAVEWQTKALAGAPETDRPEYEARLALYKSRKPYREEPGK